MSMLVSYTKTNGPKIYIFCENYIRRQFAKNTFFQVLKSVGWGVVKVWEHRFGYLQCMCLSGVSMKTILLIVVEKFSSKPKSLWFFSSHKVKSLKEFFRPVYKIYWKFYWNFTGNFTVFIFGRVFFSVKFPAKFSVKFQYNFQ